MSLSPLPLAFRNFVGGDHAYREFGYLFINDDDMRPSGVWPHTAGTPVARLGPAELGCFRTYSTSSMLKSCSAMCSTLPFGSSSSSHKKLQCSIAFSPGDGSRCDTTGQLTHSVQGT